MAGGIQELLCTLLSIYWIILIGRIIFSWVPNPPEPLLPLVRLLNALTDPVINPVRGLLPPVQMGAAAMDFSPLLVFFAIILLRNLICFS